MREVSLSDEPVIKFIDYGLLREKRESKNTSKKNIFPRFDSDIKNKNVIISNLVPGDILDISFIPKNITDDSVNIDDVIITEDHFCNKLCYKFKHNMDWTNVLYINSEKYNLNIAINNGSGFDMINYPHHLWICHVQGGNEINIVSDLNK